MSKPQSTEIDITDIVEQMKAEHQKANSYGEQMVAFLDKGSDIVLSEMLLGKMGEMKHTCEMTGVSIPPDLDAAIEARKQSIQEDQAAISELIDIAIEEAELKDWMKFAGNCKIHTQKYDGFDDQSQLVYRHLCTKEPVEKNDLRVIQTYLVRRTLALFTTEQKMALYIRLDVPSSELKAAGDATLRVRFRNFLGVDVKTLNETHDLLKDVDEKFHPIMNWIIEHTDQHSAYFQATVEQMDEASRLTLTNQRISKYAENIIVRFKMLEQAKTQQEGQEQFQRYHEELTALFKSVFAERYVGF